MKAFLRTYTAEDRWTQRLVDVDDAHVFANGPYVETVPFAVGSNQAVLPVLWRPGRRLRMWWMKGNKTKADFKFTLSALRFRRLTGNGHIDDLTNYGKHALNPMGSLEEFSNGKRT